MGPSVQDQYGDRSCSGARPGGRHALPSLALCGIHGLGATRQAPRAALVHPLRAVVSSWIALLAGRWIVCPCWARPACPCLECIAEGGRYQHFLTVPHGWDGGVRLPEAGLVPRCAGRHAWLAKSAGRFAPARGSGPCARAPFLSMRPGPCRSPCLRLAEKGVPDEVSDYLYPLDSRLS